MAMIHRPAEVLARLRRAEVRLSGRIFMVSAGATYMTANPDALFLTTLLGYGSDAILQANFDHAGIKLYSGRFGGLVNVLKKFGIDVVSEGYEGFNVEANKKIQCLRFGNGTTVHQTMQDQMAAGVAISESDFSFIKDGRTPAVSLEPGTRRYRGSPTSVVVNIYDEDNKRIEGRLDDDRMYALSHLLSLCDRLPSASGVDAVSIEKRATGPRKTPE
jgi:hypothetical protein